MSGVLLMFFLLGLRASEDRVIDLNGTLITHTRAEARTRSGGRTSVPQIFIDGAHIGGSDDLAALNRAGKLDSLLSPSA